VRTPVVLSLVTLLVSGAACKGKPKHQAPPENAATPGSAAKGSNVERAAPDIQLPPLTGRPPVKTDKQIDAATIQKLQAMTFAGFQVEQHGGLPEKGTLELRQKTEDHPRIWATVTITPCFDCVAMDLAKWKEKGDALKVLLLPELREDKGTVFEVGATQVNGTQMIYTYQLAQTSPLTEKGSGEFNPGHFAYSHAYVLYFNDGANQIRVVGEYKDDPMATKEAMANEVPRTDLENVAKAFMGAYTNAW
jgi:hypothetical protein